jgi:hypothetical protein
MMSLSVISVDVYTGSLQYGELSRGLYKIRLED